MLGGDDSRFLQPEQLEFGVSAICVSLCGSRVWWGHSPRREGLR